MNTPALKPRILLIEDNAKRIVRFREWLSDTEFVLVEASSGGRAMGILRKGATEGIAGILLDHDLDEQPVTDIDRMLSASHLMDAIVLSVKRTVPILIHSMNASKPPAMERRLKSAGFSVSRIPMAVLTHESLHAWLQDVRNNWEE